MSQQNKDIDELITNITSEINMSLRNNLTSYLQLINNNNQIVDVLKGILFQMPEFVSLKNDYSKLFKKYEHVKKELIDRKKYPLDKTYELQYYEEKFYFTDDRLTFEYLDGDVGIECDDIPRMSTNDAKIELEKYLNQKYDNETFKVVKLDEMPQKEENIKLVVKEEKELEVEEPVYVPLSRPVVITEEVQVKDDYQLEEREEEEQKNERDEEEEKEQSEEEEGEEEVEQKKEQGEEEVEQKKKQDEEEEQKKEQGEEEQGEEEEGEEEVEEEEQKKEQSEEEGEEEGEEEESEEEGEEEEEELEEIEFEGKTYNLNSKTNDVYEDEDGEVGALVGVFKNGRIVFN